MLIFQNGLFATFIPEILMVIGYILCLFAPGIKSHESSVDQVTTISVVSTFEPQKQISAYQLNIHDFQTTEITSDNKQSLPLYFKIAINIIYESPFSTSNGVSYGEFSRPPPVLLS